MKTNPGKGRFRALLGVLAMMGLASVRLHAGGTVYDCTENALRYAMTGGGDVRFNCSGTLTLANPIPVVNDTILICTNLTNAGISISGNGMVRHFTVMPGVRFEIIGLSLINGSNSIGGSISNAGTLVLERCIFFNNVAAGKAGAAGVDGAADAGVGGNGTAGGSGSPAAGGAIYNSGDLSVNHCTFRTNRVAGGNGGRGGNGGYGIYGGGNGANGGNGATAYGGAIYSSGTLDISDSLFQFNTAAGGVGGTRGVGGGTGTNTMTTYRGIDGNGGTGAIGGGGAICAASCIVTGSTFDRNNSAGGNTADAGSQNTSGDSGQNGPDSYGGGLLVTGTGSMVNCTLSGNTANGGKGGAGGSGNSLGGNGGNGGSAWGGSLHVTGQSILQNCTLAGGRVNPGAAGAGGSATSYPGTAGQPGAGHGENIANTGLYILTLQNSILAPPVNSTNISPNTHGTIADGGYNLSSDSTPVTLPASRKNKNARLIALASNGGPTPTMALQSGSPAIDVIPPGLAPDTDQRGVPRGDFSDTGAFEYSTVPTFDSQPSDLIVAQGGTAEFVAAVNGIPMPECQWYKGTNLLAGQTDTVLSLSNVGTNDAGGYYLIISNAVGIAQSRTATLTVFVPAQINLDLTNMTVAAGSTAAFQTSVSGVPTPACRWYWNSNLIAGASGQSYTITSANATNAGWYWMTASNGMGGISRVVSSTRVSLTVATNPMPVVTQDPVSLVVTNGQTAVFNVAGTGIPTPSFQWYHTTVHSNAPIPGATSTLLILTNVSPLDAGRYYAVLSNRWGSTNSVMATLTVRIPARILVQPVSVIATQGMMTTFTVTVAGDPKPSCQWRFHGTNLVGEVATNLSRVASTNTEGLYSVWVTNNLGGELSIPAALTLINPSTATNRLSLVSSNPLVLRFQYKSESGRTYILQYKPSLNSPQDWIPVDSATGNGLVIDLVDPYPPGTQGYYRVKVE
jgi:hypothetical protein